MIFTRKKRHSSAKVVIPSGTWSVRLTTTSTFVVEGVSEGMAWTTFINTIEEAELLNSGKAMAHRRGTNDHSR